MTIQHKRYSLNFFSARSAGRNLRFRTWWSSNDEELTGIFRRIHDCRQSGDDYEKEIDRRVHSVILEKQCIPSLNRETRALLSIYPRSFYSIYSRTRHSLFLCYPFVSIENERFPFLLLHLIHLFFLRSFGLSVISPSLFFLRRQRLNKVLSLYIPSHRIFPSLIRSIFFSSKRKICNFLQLVCERKCLLAFSCSNHCFAT